MALPADTRLVQDDATVDWTALVAALPRATAVFAAQPPQFTLLAASDALLAAAGRTRASLVGLPLARAFPDRGRDGESDLSELARSLEAALRTGERQAMEVQRYDLQRPDGTWEDRWWNAVNTPVRGSDGEVRWILHETEDVTERVRGERALARAERRAARILEQVSDAYTLLDRDFRLLAVNASAERLSGKARGEMLGRSHWELFPASATNEVGQAYRRVLEQGAEQHLVHHYVGDGYDLHIEVDAYPTEEGGVAVFCRDVTLRQKEVAGSIRARERAERLQALTAALAGARTLEDVANVVVADMVVALGARTGALAGRAADEDALVVLRTVGFPAPVEAGVRRQPLDMRSPLVECYRTQAPVWIEARDGPAGLDARFPVIASVWDALGVESAAFVPLVAAGETVGVISFSFVRPRTFAPEEREFLLALGRQAALAVERARLFDAEHAARADAERANQAKSEFLAVMSHELRTPLNAIGGYAELLEMGIRGPVTSQQREDLHRIQQSQRHLLGLINEVLNYAKLETGTVHFDFSDVRVRDALGGAEALVAPQARAKGLSLEVSHCPPTLVVRADAEKLRQILVNLLSNAVKFTDRGGRVELGCVEHGDRVHVAVRDTGIGIEPDQLSRIFEPFVQVRADLTRTAEGTGLGLAISRDLARRMGGDLTVESRRGEGSTFTLTLPSA